MSSNTSCAAMIAILVHNNEKRKKGRVPMKKKKKKLSRKEQQEAWERSSHLYFFFIAFLIIVVHIICIYVHSDIPVERLIIASLIFLAIEISFIAKGVINLKRSKRRKAEQHTSKPVTAESDSKPNGGPRTVEDLKKWLTT